MNKFQDMKSYYHLVRFVCAFPQRYWVSQSLDQKIIDNKWLLEKYLPEENKIHSFAMFKMIYLAYRNWVLEKYLDENYLFSNHYHKLNYYKPKNGFDKANEFKEEHGGCAETDIFLATTMADFFENDSRDLFFEAREFAIDIEAFGEVAHKMYYSCLVMKYQIGYKHIERELGFLLSDIEHKRRMDEHITRQY